MTVVHATANGSARAGSDYLPASGTLVFEPGETTKEIRIAILGDTSIESDETFFVSLRQPVNATIAIRRGTGVIVNDDAIPAAVIDSLMADFPQELFLR